MELTVRDVAGILHVPEYTVYRLIDEDKLPATEINGQFRFSREELLEWASSRSVNPIGIVKNPGPTSPQGNTLGEALRSGGLLRGIRGTDRASVLRFVVERLPLNDRADREGLLQLLLAREKAGSTAVGNGIAIPHSRYPVVLPVGRPLLTLCYLDQPVIFGTGSLGQVDTLFVLVTPTIAVHLQLLARLAAFVQDESVKRSLKERVDLDGIVAQAERLAHEPRQPADQKRAG
jgi:PTS system nitrogen regulatory IIA component